MSIKDDGGPAYPVAGIPYTRDEMGNKVWELRDGGSEGMTLRDYFIAHAPAMPATIRDAFVKAFKRGAEFDMQEYAEVSARWAIVYADAMLKARQA